MSMYGIILAEEYSQHDEKLNSKILLTFIGILLIILIVFSILFIALTTCTKQNNVQIETNKKTKTDKHNVVPVNDYKNKQTPSRLDDAELEADTYRSLWIINTIMGY